MLELESVSDVVSEPTLIVSTELVEASSTADEGAKLAVSDSGDDVAANDVWHVAV